MKAIFLAALVVCIFASTNNAQAKKHYVVLAPECGTSMPCEGGSYSARAKHFIGIPFGVPLQHYTPQRVSTQVVPRGSKPRAWCGWYMRQRKGISDTRLNLAANWARLYGSPTAPQPGAVVVWRHHVGELVSHVNGSIWMVHSGNDGHTVRTRARSIAGAIGFRA